MGLFSFNKSDKNSDATDTEDTASEKGWLQRLKSGLSKTRQGLGSSLADLFLGKKEIDDELLEDIETSLLSSDVGIETTQTIIKHITESIDRKGLKDSQQIYQALRSKLVEILQPVERTLEFPEQDEPFVILVVGVNGAGKTTTIGKLAKHLQTDGKHVMLAAGDTFRAAAVEQLQTWGERNDISVVAQHTGADCAAVIFDAMQSAQAKKIDVLIADTAGRLQTQGGLMDELKKVKRVIGKHNINAPHEVLLVLDAGTGQNALIQAKQFNDAVNITGLAITKLDGTAKGGILFAMAEQMGLPIRFIGVGEGIDDLQAFHAEEFVDALLEIE